MASEPSRPRKRRRARPRAGPVTLTHVDGSTETQRAYSPRELKRIDRRASEQPRTWNEVNSSKGGGRDFGPKR